MPKSSQNSARHTAADSAFAALPLTILLTSGVAFLVASGTGAPLLFGLLALLVGQAFALAAAGVGDRRSSTIEAPKGPAAEFGGVAEEALADALRQAQEQVDATAADRYVVVGSMGRLTVKQGPPPIPGAAFILVRTDGGIVLGEVAADPLGAILRTHEESALVPGMEEERS